MLVIALLGVADVNAHQVTFNSSMTYSDTQPTGGADSIANWTGAVFDAANIDGSGVNADGGNDNGTANNDYTYVANDRPVQGQSFLTGSAANGYQLNTITVRMAGYTNNIATGSNQVYWNLHEQNGPIILTINEINGTTRTTITSQLFKAGNVDNPGSGSNANGPGDYITFHLPFTTYLKPDTTYGFEFIIGNGGANYFEWLGTSADPYSGGTAYHYSGSTITPLAGDHVFMADMTALTSPPAAFSHPGTLHTQADLDRMAAKVAANEEPWKSGYNMLASSPYGTGWPAAPVAWIVRGGTDPQNYTRSQQDAQAIYECALRWKVTGDTAYADHAVYIANAWSSTLVGVTGDSNAALGYGICGYLFAIGGDVLSTYPGWAAADKQAYKDMMMRVFYPSNANFLWWHYDTFWREGGNTHYRLNWDTANMASMAAIGILCDNRTVYEQALDFFKYGPGNSRIERAAWYLHPGGFGQGEEAGRDQGHNLGGWHCMALLCQMAWNQGDDLFGYDNNRVLRAFEYNAKYNLGNDVPYARHRNSSLTYSEGSVSGSGRGIGQYYQYELVYNHYVNVKGIAAPWGEQAAEATRPEPWPNTGIHPSQADWLGLGTLTYTQEAITNDVAPSGLRVNWSKNQIILDWWGSARATSYLVKRAISLSGPYTQIGTVTGSDLNFTDTDVANGMTYYYIVTAQTPSGDLDSDPLLVMQELVTHYTFEGNVDDVAGTQDATLHGGSTGLPGYTTGFGGGQAIDLDGVDDYVQLPVGAANFQDLTVAAWVRWDGGSNWQRVFDFGSEIEKNLYLTPSNGGGVIEVGFTTTRWGNEYGDAAYSLTGSSMPTGTWTHLAFTLNGDVMTLYVNGVPVDTEINDLIDPLYSQVFCYIGKSMWNPDPLFNGRIDDFRIYNFALSGDEVWDLWGQSANHAPVFTADPITKPDAYTDVPYAGQTLAANANDADGNPLTFTKIAGPPWLSIASNGTLSGTPVNDDAGENVFVVRVTDSIGATDDAYLIITVPIFTSNPIYELNAAELTFYSSTLADDASYPESGSLAFSKDSGPDWLVVASDGTLSGMPKDSDIGENTFTVRVEDTLARSDTATMTIQVANIYNGTQGLEDLLGQADQWLMLGCTDTPACGGADLDDSNDVTLTDFSILAHNWLVPEDLQLHLRFDELTGTIASDSSIYWRDGTLINSPAWDTGYTGGALSFDGSNYVEVSDDDGLNPDTDSFSVAFWMKSDTPSQGALIVSKRQSTSPYPGYLIGLSNGSPTTFTAGSKLTFLLGAESGDRKGGYTTNDIVFNEWTHVCVVLDQDADTVYIYINGISVPIIRTPDNTLVTINTTTPVYIGKNPGVSSKPYYGLVDDVRIYNVALSAQEIAELAQ